MRGHLPRTPTPGSHSRVGVKASADLLFTLPFGCKLKFELRRRVPIHASELRLQPILMPPARHRQAFGDVNFGIRVYAATIDARRHPWSTAARMVIRIPAILPGAPSSQVPPVRATLATRRFSSTATPSADQLGALRWIRPGGAFALRQERRDQRILEVEGLGEILAAIGVLFAEHLFFDQVKDHIADVLALAHAPFVHQRGRHRPELLQGKIPEARKQFGAADVPDLARIAIRHPLEGEIQRVLEEKIGVRVKTFVAFEDRNHRLFELHRLHAGQRAG